MAYNSSAYDFSRFEPQDNTVRKPAPQKKATIKTFPKNKQKPRIKPKKSGKPAVGIIVFVAIVMMICYNIYAMVEISNVSTQIANANREIRVLRSEETRLNVELENMISRSNLEREAARLGMQRRSRAQVRHIDTSTESFAEIIE